MSYNDPYYPPQGNTRYQQAYRDTPEYDPYNAQQQRHPTYDGAGFVEDEQTLETSPVQTKKERGEYDQTPFATTIPTPRKSRSGLISWRRDFHGNLWTKGGRGRCIGRFCCCTLLIGLFLFASILFTLGIFIRPPNIQINNVGFPTTGSAFQVTSSSLNINLGVNITVDNPNYFAVSFRRIKADLTYPTNNMDVGGGERNNIVFRSNSETTFDFPLIVSYNVTDDPNRAVLTDLLTKCGIVGGQKTNLVVRYRITLGIRIVFVTISPSFSNQFSFECPVTQSDIDELLRGSGITIPGLNG